jgi:flagellum-specific ATP synthase
MKLRAMVAHFEDTRDLRLMGGYQRGADAELDRSVDLIPRLYEAMKQSLFDPASSDAFQEIARALSEGREDPNKQQQQQTRT